MNLQPKRKLQSLILFTLSFFKKYWNYRSSANVIYKLLLNVLSFSLFYSTEKNKFFGAHNITISVSIKVRFHFRERDKENADGRG